MSETKRVMLAHRLILSKLRELANRYKDLIEAPADKEIEIFLTIRDVRLLVGILGGVLIPERERALVINGLEEASEIANYVLRELRESPVTSLLKDLANELRVE